MNLLRPHPRALIALRRTRFYLRILCVAGSVVVAVSVTAHAALGGVLAATATRGGLPSVWAGSPSSAGPSFRWPLAGTPAVVVPFDPPAQPWLPGHRGVDLASEPGAKVYAAGAGTVAFAGIVAGVGVVSVDHAGGLRTTYEPVQPSVHAGARVPMGGPIGVLLAGHPSCPAGVPACLHWGLRRGSVYLDPLLLLGLAPVRLLPSGPRFAGMPVLGRKGTPPSLPRTGRKGGVPSGTDVRDGIAMLSTTSAAEKHMARHSEGDPSAPPAAADGRHRQSRADRPPPAVSGGPAATGSLGRPERSCRRGPPPAVLDDRGVVPPRTATQPGRGGGRGQERSTRGRPAARRSYSSGWL